MVLSSDVKSEFTFENFKNFAITLFDMGFFELSALRGSSWLPHKNFVVIAPMTIKFGTGMKLDVF